MFLLIGFLYSLFKLCSYEGELLSVRSELPLSEQISLLKLIKYFLQQYSILIFLPYMIGLAGHIFLLLTGLHKINNLKRNAGLKLLQEWQNKLKFLSYKFGLSTEISLFFSDKLIVPFTIGFLKPIIYFPIGMLNQLTIEQVEAILLHELAHIKRNDYLINIIQRLVETVLFFNPVVWLFAQDLKNEREYCCDDLVLSYTSNPETYAKALLLIEENRTDYDQLAMAADGAGNHSLFNRIKRFHVLKTVNSNPKHKLLGITALVAVSLSLACAVPADSSKSEKAKYKLFAKSTVPPPPPMLANPVADTPIISDTTKLAPPPPPQAPSKVRFTKPMPKIAPPPPPEPPKNSGTSIQDTTDKVSKYFNSKALNEQQEKIASVGKYFDGPEWKAQQEKIEKINRYFNGEEWKAQLAEIKKKERYFSSPEWKAKVQEM